METAERARVPRSARRTIVTLLVVGGGVLLTPYLMLFGTIGWQGLEERMARRPFEPAAWRAATAYPVDAEPLRLRMVDDLLERRLLDGRTRAEVVALLGAPPATGYFRDYDLVYLLGPERSFLSIDSEWLGVRFGPDGRVAEAALLRD
jgi:hypothetical protein